ncbi:RHS repeat domain-containing protein, partial [Escherichia coli]|uniref:RHS repeat domain-containing protein n=1 Tax=Escherichia coli TaxID=562 RepID=UPI00157B49C9
LRLSPHRYLATNSPQGPWWLLGWCERVPEADEVLPAPLPPYRAYDSRGQLIAVKDTQGHETRYEYNAAGDLTTVIAPDGSRN